MASGDDDPTDSDENGFIPMFGDFHNRMGHGDWFQLSGTPTFLNGGIGDAGIQGLAVGWNGMFASNHEIGVELWSYKSDQDVPIAGGATSDKIGKAVDVWYGYNYSKNLTFTAALSQFSPDDAITGAGGAPDDKAVRLYGNARLRF